MSKIIPVVKTATSTDLAITCLFSQPALNDCPKPIEGNSPFNIRLDYNRAMESAKNDPTDV
jgi:hypothetical protein